MSSVSRQHVTCIHGWLFGPYIWSSIHRDIEGLKKPELISLSGYKENFENDHDVGTISDVLKSQSDNDVILAYSYSASLILCSEYLSSCKGNIFLINPFFKEKKEVIDKLINEIKNDLDTSIKKFIFEATKGCINHKKNYSELYSLYKSNHMPSPESLCSGLNNLKELSCEPPISENSKKIHILQSINDQVTDLNFFYNCEKQKVNTYRLEGLAHYPFFDFARIYDIIKDKL